MGPVNDPRVCLSWATCGLPLIGHTGVCNNFQRGTHGFCLSKDPHGTHMKPMCICHLYGPCWATMWLPLLGLTWAATEGASRSMQQFAMWVFCLSKYPHGTHIKPMCVYNQKRLQYKFAQPGWNIPHYQKCPALQPAPYDSAHVLYQIHQTTPLITLMETPLCPYLALPWSTAKLLSPWWD